MKNEFILYLPAFEAAIIALSAKLNPSADPKTKSKDMRRNLQGAAKILDIEESTTKLIHEVYHTSLTGANSPNAIKS